MLRQQCAMRRRHHQIPPLQTAQIGICLIDGLLSGGVVIGIELVGHDVLNGLAVVEGILHDSHGLIGLAAGGAGVVRELCASHGQHLLLNFRQRQSL